MTARILSLAALALAPLAFAAPAPFLPPATPPQPQVELRGPRPGPGVGFVPQVITSEASYRGVAEALGVRSPPKVNFRTHFLFVQVSAGYGALGCEIVSGDLRGTGGQAGGELEGVGIARLGLRQIKCGLRPPSSGFLIKSFPRSTVKTVNGAPLPRE